MEAADLSEMLVALNQRAQHQIPENSNVLIQNCLLLIKLQFLKDNVDIFGILEASQFLTIITFEREVI
jgi:hypothetical protein